MTGTKNEICKLCNTHYPLIYKKKSTKSHLGSHNNSDPRTGQPKGFGFVTFKDAAGDFSLMKKITISSMYLVPYKLQILSLLSIAAEVVRSREHTIDGRVVDVKLAVAKDKAPAPTRYSNCDYDALSAFVACSVCYFTSFCFFVHRYCVYVHVVEEIVDLFGSAVDNNVKRLKYSRNREGNKIVWL